MRIIWEEIKKIWRPERLLIIGLISVMFYLIFLGTYIEFFPNGHPTIESYQLAFEMTEQFGTRLDEDEFNEFFQQRSELNDEVEQAIASEEILLQLGITTFEDLKNYEEASFKQQNEGPNADFLVAKSRIYGSEYGFIGFRLQVMNDISGSYINAVKRIESEMQYSVVGTALYERYAEIKETHSYQNIMVWSLIDNTELFYQYLGILIILSVIVLISPTLLADQIHDILPSQYSSKAGRLLLKRQVIAGMISSVALVVVMLTVFGLLYGKTGYQHFFMNGIGSFMNSRYIWFEISYGQWLILMIVCLLIIVIAVTLITSILSCSSRTYVSLILKLVPMFVGIVALQIWVAHDFLQIYKTKGIEFIAAITLVLIGFMVFYFYQRRVRLIDIQS